MESATSKKAHFVSLGCARNRVDTEVMVGTLLGKGWEYEPEPEQANVVIVNTCGFIEAAKEESVEKILEFAALKEEQPDLRLVVAGCLTQRYKKSLAAGLPEVDLFIGTDQFARLGELLEEQGESGAVHARRTHYIYNESLPRVNSLASNAAYLKVAEGCQHNCAFCIIPAIRGRLRSRPVSSVVAEAKNLGVYEVNLIAQDLAAYGRDLGSDLLMELLRELVALPELGWIRLLYMYPENIRDEFLELMATEPKIMKYLDIPVQHASDAVLARMNRHITRDQLRAKFERARERVPDMSIRTSVMVGFPGETQQDFEQLLAFVKEVEFDHLGCFTYSQEEGTPAGRMSNQIAEELKQERQSVIMAAQKEISAKRLRRFIGQTLPVLGSAQPAKDGFAWSGRTSFQAPEVDGSVLVVDPRHQEQPRDFSKPLLVHITDALDYDLVGKVES